MLGVAGVLLGVAGVVLGVTGVLGVLLGVAGAGVSRVDRPVSVPPLETTPTRLVTIETRLESSVGLLRIAWRPDAGAAGVVDVVAIVSSLLAAAQKTPK